MVKDVEKSQAQLIEELKELRRWVDALERERIRYLDQEHWNAAGTPVSGAVSGAQVPEQPAPSMQNARIVCVSNPAHVKSLCQVLEPLGHQVTAASTPEEVARLQGHFDLGVFDINTHTNSPVSYATIFEMVGRQCPGLTVERALALDILDYLTGMQRGQIFRTSGYCQLDLGHCQLQGIDLERLTAAVNDVLSMPPWQDADFFELITDRMVHSFVESSMAPMLVIDKHERVIFANLIALSMFKRPTALMKGIHIEELLSNEGSIECYRQLRDRTARIIGSDTELSMRARDGLRFDALVCMSRVFSSLVPEGSRVLTFHDVTEFKRLQWERRELEIQIQKTQRLESLGILAGGIAHDFNNLLVSILGHTELALGTMSEEAPATRNLRQIQTTAQHAAGLTRQMLAYSGQGGFVREPVDLVKVTREMHDLLDVSTRKKGHLILDLDDDTPPVMGDVSQMRQILLNLVTNAGEAIQKPPGEIVIRIGVCRANRTLLERSVVDSELTPGDVVFLEVRDTGCGMDEETLAKIFEPYFSTKMVGRGLGMATVLGIIRGYRGAILVDSQVNQGTTFTVFFSPVSDSGAGTEAQGIRQIVSAAEPGLALVVDDEETVREVAAATLRKHGWHVLEAADGIEALNAMRSHAQEINIILLDLTMPNMDGRAALREIRRLKPEARVLLTSGYTQNYTMEGIAQDGRIGFIQKPYMPSDLVEMISRLLARG
jgi:signal transduction histidine kinase/ActR/RegA family two-component response regulator